MKKKLSKVIALLLSVLMLVGIAPTYAFAGIAFNESQLNVVTDKASVLANGVEQNAYTAYDKNGEQVKLFVTTADMSVDTVKLFASYKNMDPTSFGMSKLTEQVAAFNEKAAAGDDYYQGTVVAGINASYYNMTTGQPMGLFVMNGVVGNANANSAQGYFAVLKDGSVKIARANNYAADKNNIQEAIGIHIMLIENGTICSGLDSSNKYPRQTIGITADNKVVLMTADGNQAPSSVGLTALEQAQVMKDLGCVWAGHLDGGGSATYACKPEGSDNFTVQNSPADGSERSVSNGFIIVSTEAASYSFDHVAYETANEYVTPGTSVNVSVSGVSSTGNAADIPADVTYKVDNGTFADGVFTAGSDVKDAVITAMYNGKAVGSTTIHVVVPDSIKFKGNEIVVPYGKTVNLGIQAMYGLNEVVIKAEDVKFTLANETIGTIDGFNFTAGAEGSAAAESTITAALADNSDVAASTVIKLGKGSEVLFDFEDGSTSNFKLTHSNYNYYLPNSKVSVADASNGKVHSGNYSLALNIDYSNSLESGYQMIGLQMPLGKSATINNAKRIGMWIYIPDENVSLWSRWVIEADGKRSVAGQEIDGDATSGDTGYVYCFEESGWHYLSIDVSSYSRVVLRGLSEVVQFYISDRDGTKYNYYFKNQNNLNGNFTFYVDDITVDYSSAVDDREAPIFSELNYGTANMSDAAAISKDNIPTVNYNEIDFAAKVAENTAKSNATGIDASSAKAYIDGNEVACTYANGVISMDNSAVFADGKHTVKFSICDNQGNYASIIRKVNVQANSGASTVKVVAHDKNANRVLLDSVNYIDIVATDIEKVQSVEAKLDLDNMSKWQLDHMEVAEGFEATWSVENYDATDNIATVKINRTGDVKATGEAALVSIPVRAWTLENSNKVKPMDKTKEWTLAEFKANKESWPIAIDLEVDMGLVTFTDGTTDTFTGDDVFIWTEMWGNYANMTATEEGTAYYNSWNGGHLHTVEEVADKPATCTETGYTARTYCDVCKSVVDWGTTVPAAGHTYADVNGVFKCTVCGEIANGVVDGKTYIDGIAANGWIDDSYYADGVKFTGICEAEGYYYDFGDDGVCDGKVKYTGFVKKDEGWYYSVVGKFAKGWMNIDDEYYYFDPETGLAYYGKEYYIYQQTYKFDEKGKVIDGLWVESDKGTQYFYGPSCYTRTWAEIDGKTYYFDVDGYRKEGTCWFIAGSSNNPPKWYEFTEDGALVREFDETGLFTFNGKTYYLKNGVNQYGLIDVNGSYYYFRSSDYTAVTGRYWVGNTNGLDFACGYYDFDADGKMIIPGEETEKNGIINENGTLYYYVNGERNYAGLFELDGNYYYANTYGVISTGRYWISKTNGIMAEGFYDFAADGKMIIAGEEPEKDGIIVSEDDGLYYYVNGERTYAGLFELDGDYYYANTFGKISTGRYWISKTNDIMPAGFYDFDTDGKMIIAGEEPDKCEIVNENGELYYYVNGERTYAGLFRFDGSYYYANTYGKIATGRYWISKTNDILPAGFYDFDENGRMLLDKDPAKNGIFSEDGTLYYYVNGEKTYAGLFELDGNYYYANTYGVISTGKYWISKTNDIMPAGFYNFAEDGKMIMS